MKDLLKADSLHSQISIRTTHWRIISHSCQLQKSLFAYAPAVKNDLQFVKYCQQTEQRNADNALWMVTGGSLIWTIKFIEYSSWNDLKPNLWNLEIEINLKFFVLSVTLRIFILETFHRNFENILLLLLSFEETIPTAIMWVRSSRPSVSAIIKIWPEPILHGLQCRNGVSIHFIYTSRFSCSNIHIIYKDIYQPKQSTVLDICSSRRSQHKNLNLINE